MKEMNFQCHSIFCLFSVSFDRTFLFQEKMESQMKPKMSHLPEGLELEISNHPLTMKSVANLIIALDRLKGSSSSSASLLSTEFRDENLLNIMFDSIVEGKGRGRFQLRFQHSRLFLSCSYKLKCSITRRANCAGALFSSTFSRQVQQKQRGRLQRDRQREEELGQGPKQHGAPRSHASGRLRVPQRWPGRF